MHISEPPRQSSNTILTKCSKMTEERHKRHGMNGNADSHIKDDSASKTNYVQGGRLKFFKDGKFILELERAREGERVSWVSVPRKTFWPPQGTASSTPTYRQESSASLSVSDDNSSIQSSPWQRDHSWKQSSPRRNQSKELVFYYWRPRSKRSICKIGKSRRPYSTTIEDVRVVCGVRTSSPNNNNNNNNHHKRSGVSARRASLLVIVQNLLDKTSTTTTTTTATTTTTPRVDVVVSPRKRFLREMEKDKVQVDDSCQKRSRNKTQPQQQQQQQQQQQTAKVATNGVTEDVKPTQRNCSYSITSLLAEDRNVKRSPTPSNSPSHFTQPQYCSPSADDRWYSESVDRLRSIELSQAEKRGYPPYPHPSYLPHYMYPYTLPPYYGPNVYGRGYIMPPVYHAPPLPLALRHDTPSCSWAADPPRDLEHRDDNITDMPLNLSKHAG